MVKLHVFLKEHVMKGIVVSVIKVETKRHLINFCAFSLDLKVTIHDWEKCVW